MFSHAITNLGFTMMRVLVIEDDPALAEAVVRELRRQGYDADSVGTGREALRLHRIADLVLLDLGLADIDGLQVCQAIRAESDIPILAFTDRQGELDRVLGLQAGADDCLDKPYGIRELLARINAVMRRVRPHLFKAEPIRYGALRLDPAAREAWLADRQLELTRKEFDLLRVLASRPNRVFSRRELMELVWHNQCRATGRTLDTHVNSLRNKLGSRDSIMTVRGVGFRLSGDALLRLARRLDPAGSTAVTRAGRAPVSSTDGPPVLAGAAGN